jgi:hypothetical protein
MKPCKYILEIHSNIVINYLTLEEFRYFFAYSRYDDLYRYLDRNSTKTYTYVCGLSNIRYGKKWGDNIIKLVE